MQTGRSLLVVVCGILAISCGSPSAPTDSSTNLTGSWGSAWRWSEVAVYNQGLTGGPSTQVRECTAAIDITSQNANSFAGRYAIECAATRYSGAVTDGHLSFNNQVSFSIVAETGGDPAVAAGWSYPSCQIADPHRYEGTLSGDALNVSRNLTIDCPPGRLLVSSTFQGTRRQ
jgi:hypothetical protein